MIAQNEINRQKGLEKKTDNHTVSDKHHKGSIDCTIIRYPRMGVKHTWQVYVISELKIKLLCFFTYHGINFHRREQKDLLAVLRFVTIQNEPKLAKTKYAAHN